MIELTEHGWSATRNRGAVASEWRPEMLLAVSLPINQRRSRHWAIPTLWTGRLTLVGFVVMKVFYAAMAPPMRK